VKIDAAIFFGPNVSRVRITVGNAEHPPVGTTTLAEALKNAAIKTEIRVDPEADSLRLSIANK